MTSNPTKSEPLPASAAAPRPLGGLLDPLVARLKSLASAPPTMRALLVLTAWFALAAPLWFYTLKTHRAPLNYTDLARYDAEIGSLMKARVPITILAPPQLVDIVDAVQLVSDHKLADLGISNWTFEVSAPAPADAGADQVHGAYDDIYGEALSIHLKQESTSGFHLDPHNKTLWLNYDLELLQMGTVADMVVEVLFDQVYAQELEWWMGSSDLSEHTAVFSPQYHIALSVLSGDGSRVSWDSARFLELFSGLRTLLNDRVVNITIDSQIGYYAQPGCDTTLEKGKHMLNHADLTTFVNFAEWDLASTMAYPTLHFVLYLPSQSQTPMEIEGSQSNAFIVSQWGGVTIQNKLDVDAFYTVFQTQLLSLLGCPSMPKSLVLRLDSLARIFTARTVRAAAASLGSLDRLAHNMASISIPPQVADNAHTALEYLQRSLASINTSAFAAANKQGGVAYRYAERAFFDKHMVSQAFFPDEHKMAVYLPLLAPIALLLYQRWRSLKLWQDAGFRKELKRCDDEARARKVVKVKKD